MDEEDLLLGKKKSVSQANPANQWGKIGVQLTPSLKSVTRSFTSSERASNLVFILLLLKETQKSVHDRCSTQQINCQVGGGGWEWLSMFRSPSRKEFKGVRRTIL